MRFFSYCNYSGTSCTSNYVKIAPADGLKTVVEKGIACRLTSAADRYRLIGGLIGVFGICNDHSRPGEATVCGFCEGNNVTTSGA